MGVGDRNVQASARNKLVKQVHMWGNVRWHGCSVSAPRPGAGPEEKLEHEKWLENVCLKPKLKNQHVCSFGI